MLLLCTQKDGRGRFRETKNNNSYDTQFKRIKGWR